MLADGKTATDIYQQLGVIESTWMRRTKQLSGRKLNIAKQLKALERDNTRLEKLFDEQSFVMEILKEAVKGNG